MSSRFSAVCQGNKKEIKERPVQTIIDDPQEKKLSNPINRVDLKPFFLPNYNPICRTCYGRGHEGFNEKEKLFIPCYKCRGKSSASIDLRSGLISKE